eukprot:GHVS01046656.1.p1 GENE.GHVS01046656.1~~GHVS01046656.1.p1  ORF type:complete len:227 (-),score=25.51 GHVS01046656.1:112-792(-)
MHMDDIYPVAMVQVVKHSGRVYAKSVRGVVAALSDSSARLDACAKEYNNAIKALERGNRTAMPKSVADSLDNWKYRDDCGLSNLLLPMDESFSHLQMMLSVTPTSALFDTWYHLFIRALKWVLCFDECAWDDANWTMATLPTEFVDKRHPQFVAIKTLETVQMPQFVVDYLIKNEPMVEEPGAPSLTIVSPVIDEGDSVNPEEQHSNHDTEEQHSNLDTEEKQAAK